MIAEEKSPLPAKPGIIDRIKLFFDGIGLWFVRGNSLAVLGMKGAGKTQFYYTLKQMEYKDPTGTGVEDYDTFAFAYGDRKIKVRHGRDIGGGEAYIRENYEEMIQKNDIIFFVFDASMYDSNEQYAKDVRARMSFIWRNMRKKYGDKESIKYHLVTLGSHLDVIPALQQSDLHARFMDSVKDKDFSSMFNDNFILCDLRERNKFMNELIKNEIF